VRLALISDLHGNLAAAERVASDLRRQSPDRIVCLGDVAAIGPWPRETLEFVRALGCAVVMGNTDAALLDLPPVPEDNQRLRRFADLHRWAAAQLSAPQRDFIRGFRAAVAVPEIPGGLLCCHGSPRSFEEGIVATTPDAELAEMLRDVDTALVAAGHTHVALVRKHAAGTFVNPGSVGMPSRINPAPGAPAMHAHAEYALITVDGRGSAIELRRVPFDPEPVRAAGRAAGLPHVDWWLDWWRFD
jgi:predicted phosphodiesterase